MTLPRSPGKSTLLLQQAWIQASTAEKPLELRCGTPSAATNLRIRLYSAVKHARNNPDSNPTLAKAAEECTIRVDTEDKSILRLGRVTQLDPSMVSLAQQLGVKIEELQTPEERAAEASLRKLMELDEPKLPEAPSLEGVRNKYY